MRADLRSAVIYGLLSGLFAGVTVCFKLVFAPLFVAFWLVVAWSSLGFNRYPVRTVLLAQWSTVTIGVVAVLAAVAFKFHADGALDELLWTAFEYPPQALSSSSPAPYYRLASSALYFFGYYAVWSVFILIAVFDWWRNARDDVFVSLLLTWAVVGALIIFIQSFSWWSYHFLSYSRRQEYWASSGSIGRYAG